MSDPIARFHTLRFQHSASGHIIPEQFEKVREAWDRIKAIGGTPNQLV